MATTINLTKIDDAARSRRSYQLLIDGVWRDGAGGRQLERVSPGHGVVVSSYAVADPRDVDDAVLAARRAFDSGPWPRMQAQERSAILAKAASLIEQRKVELARLDALESGKPIAQAIAEIEGAANIWHYAAALTRVLHGDSYANLGPTVLGVVTREPIGVVSIITPWNFPLLIVSQKLPFALAAGCTAVVKPSEMTSASTLVLGKLLMEAGLPRGVVNIVVGDGPSVGGRMTAHEAVDMISFTGSTRVGKLTMATAAATLKKVSMELGGKNGQIVFPDADLDAVMDAVLFGAFFNAGECCNAGSRLILHRSLAKEFLGALAERAKAVPVGDPLENVTKVGAIITDQHLTKIETYVAGASSQGAAVRLGGTRLTASGGQYMAPTIVSGVTESMAIASEEVFGPVLSVQLFDDRDEAIRIANATTYGLSASVWSRDIDTCVAVSRGVQAGTVWVNTFMDGFAELPFGGYKQSGLGRELGRHAVEDFTEEKTIHFHQGPRTGWWLSRSR
jgi:acyl-CoA reductase-like NAD-dependent aldehyde dehydrogenase